MSKENPLLSLTLTIIIPVIILFNGDKYVSPLAAVAIALAFPILYGLYDILIKKHWSIFAIIGIISIILTGGISLLQLDPRWIAVKEAGVPLILGIIVLSLTNTKYNLFEKILGELVNKEILHKALKKNKTQEQYTKLMKVSSYWFAASFLLSALLNYIVAKIFVQSPPGSTAYNDELARMTAMSFPLISVPMTIIIAILFMYILNTLNKLSKLELEELINNDNHKKT